MYKTITVEEEYLSDLEEIMYIIGKWAEGEVGILELSIAVNKLLSFLGNICGIRVGIKYNIWGVIKHSDKQVELMLWEIVVNKLVYIILTKVNEREYDITIELENDSVIMVKVVGK